MSQTFTDTVSSQLTTLFTLGSELNIVPFLGAQYFDKD
jgi:hypothetical protein